MEIRKIQMEDADNYLDILLNLDNETKFMMFEPGERPTDINIVKNIIEKSNIIMLSILSIRESIKALLFRNINIMRIKK